MDAGASQPFMLSAVAMACSMSRAYWSDRPPICRIATIENQQKVNEEPGEATTGNQVSEQP
jgi:hypothetical protein